MGGILTNGTPERFQQVCGDNFIAGLKTGGEFFAIYQITSTKVSERESISVQVQAAYGAGNPLASAEVDTAIKTATASSKDHLAVTVHVFRQGTVSKTDLTLSDILTTASSFPIEVAAGH